MRLVPAAHQQLGAAGTDPPSQPQTVSPHGGLPAPTVCGLPPQVALGFSSSRKCVPRHSEPQGVSYGNWVLTWLMAVPGAPTLEGLPKAHSAAPRGRTSVSGTVAEARVPPVTMAPAPQPPCDAHRWWQYVVWSVHVSQQQAGDGPRQVLHV